jgi:FAD/FMN-containing dehydrogenase
MVMGDANGHGRARNQSWFGEPIHSPQGVIETPTREARVSEILQDHAGCPSPVRPVGSRHSMTPCISALAAGNPERWGTLVDMTQFTSLCDAQGERTGEPLRIDRTVNPMTVTVPAGRRFYDVAHELKDHGLQFSVNTELGSLTLGAAACGATKDSSFPGEHGQVCHDAVGMRLIRPDGSRQELTERDADDLAALRCSYGLLGIVTEVTFRVYPLEYISLKHEKIKPEGDSGRFAAVELKRHIDGWLRGDQNAVFLYMFPYRDRLVAELRRKPATGGEKEEKSTRLRLRNYFWEKGLHELQSAAGGMQGAQDLFDKLMQEFLSNWLQLGQINPVAQIVDFDAESENKHRFTFSMWAFREDRFPEVLPQYLELCRKHAATYRSCLPHVSYHIARDTSSLLSYSYDGPVWTLDPICPYDERMQPEWRAFLEEFNEFCSERGGVPLLNQTPYLTRRHVERAFGTERLVRFEAARRRFDPDGRMLNDYFAQLLTP